MGNKKKNDIQQSQLDQLNDYQNQAQQQGSLLQSSLQQQNALAQINWGTSPKIKRANFNKSLLIFVNFMDNVTNDLFSLSLQDNFLRIKNKTDSVCLIPLSNVASLELCD